MLISYLDQSREHSTAYGIMKFIIDVAAGEAWWVGRGARRFLPLSTFRVPESPSIVVPPESLSIVLPLDNLSLDHTI